MTQGRQGGSVLSFVVIGGVLVLLLLGGVYFVRQRTSVEAANNNPAPAPTSNQSDTKNEKQAEKPKQDQAANKKDKTSSETKPSESVAQQQGENSSPGTTALPQTGPVETLMTLLSLGLLVATFTAYIRSRREFLSL